MRVFLVVPRGWVWVLVAGISTSKGTSAQQILNLPLEIPLTHLDGCRCRLRWPGSSPSLHLTALSAETISNWTAQQEINPQIFWGNILALPPQTLRRDTLYLLTAERQSSLKQWMLFSANCRLPGTVVCGNNASEESISNGLLIGLDFFFVFNEKERGTIYCCGVCLIFATQESSFKSGYSHWRSVNGNQWQQWQTEMQWVVSIRSINKTLYCKIEKSLSTEKST